MCDGGAVLSHDRFFRVSGRNLRNDDSVRPRERIVGEDAIGGDRKLELPDETTSSQVAGDGAYDCIVQTVVFMRELFDCGVLLEVNFGGVDCGLDLFCAVRLLVSGRTADDILWGC